MPRLAGSRTRLLYASLLGALIGCSGEPRNLAGTVWRVEDIDEGGIIDDSMVTMQLDDDDRIAGSTGCNRYFGGVTIDGGRISASAVGSTRRACAPALMDQEQRFLEALDSVVRFEVDSDTWLLLFDADGRQRLKLIEIESDPTAGAG